MHLVSKDVDLIIAEYIECPNDFRNLLLVNKYCNKLVYDNLLFKEWKCLFSKGKISFINACKHGCLEICKYLFIKDKVDIHAENDWAFSSSCGNGHLEVAKWLYQLDGKINIHADNDGAFRWSCYYDHLEVAGSAERPAGLRSHG